MRAITLTQPWASLMASGEKRIETRSWAPRELHMGEPVAIHAAKGFADMTELQFCRLCVSEPFRSALKRARDRGLIVQHGEFLVPADLPRGCVVAIAEFYTALQTDSDRCDEAIRQSVAKGAPHEAAFGNYGPERWAWIFVRIRPLKEPIPARGAQGLWKWEPPAELEYLEVAS